MPFNGGTGQAPSGLHRLEDSQLWISPGKGCTYADCPGSVDPRVSRLPDHLAPGSDTGRWDAGVWAALWESWSMGQAALGIQHVGEANDPTRPERHSHPFGCTWIKKRLWFPCYLVWGKQYIKASLISPRLSSFLLGFVLASWCFSSPVSLGWTEGKIAKFKSEGWCFLQCGPIIFLFGGAVAHLKKIWHLSWKSLLRSLWQNPGLCHHLEKFDEPDYFAAVCCRTAEADTKVRIAGSVILIWSVSPGENKEFLVYQYGAALTTVG